MENNLRFNSSICTSRSQSERLLALGLKKETADMCYQVKFFNPFPQNLVDCVPSLLTHPPINDERFIPAWSLHRLIEMIPSNIIENEKRYDFSLDRGCSLYEYDDINEFGGYEYDCIGTSKTLLIYMMI